MRRPFVVAVVVLALATGACSGGGHRSARRDTSPVVDLRTVTVSGAGLRSLADSDRAFGIDLLRHAPAGGNVVLSPLSVAVALQMAYVGARGTTAREMAAAMHLTATSPTQVAAAASAQLRALPAAAGSGTLDISDDTWVQDGESLQRSFVTAMSSGFGASLHRTDFVRATESARRRINDTVTAETHGKIRDLMPAGSIDGSTRLVLTNAVYLKQHWSEPFETAVPAPFHPSPGASEQVPTMHLQGELRYAAGAGWRAVEIPYAGDKLAMDIVLPDGTNPPDATMAGQAIEALRNAHAAFVDLALPKFRFTWQSDLVRLLRQLGVRAAFSAADFSGITTQDSLSINVVQHQALIDVNEYGTEAAAATGVGMGVSGIVVPPSRVTFTVDHPFLLAVVDTADGLPFFLGRVNDPAQG